MVSSGEAGVILYMCGSRKGPVNICQQDGGEERPLDFLWQRQNLRRQNITEDMLTFSPLQLSGVRPDHGQTLVCRVNRQHRTHLSKVNPAAALEPWTQIRQSVSQIKLEQIYQRSMWRSDLKTSCGWEDLSTQELVHLVHFHPTVQEARSSTAGLDPEPPRRSYLLDWLILPHQSIRATPPPTNTITQLHRP